MDSLLFVVALAVALWAGLGVTLLLADPRAGHDPLGRIELPCLAALLGLGAVSLLSFAAGVLVDGTTRPLVTVGCLALGVAGSWRGRHVLRHWVGRRSVEVGGIVSVLVIAGTSAVVLWFAWHQPLGWDGAVIWEFKAQLAFDHGGRVPRAYFRDETRLWSHPTYPLFMPLTEAWFYGWWRRTDEHLIKLLFPVFFVAAAGMLHAGCARLAGGGAVRARWAAVAAPLVLLAVPMMVSPEGGAGSGYVDAPLAAIFLAAVVHALHYARCGSAQSLRLAGGLAALLPWVKQEGLVLFACCACLLLVAVVWRGRDRSAGRAADELAGWRAVAWVVLPGVAVVAGWRAYLRHLGATTHDEYLPFTWATFRSNTGRAPTIASSLWREVVAWDRWGALWPVVAVAAVVWAWRARGAARVMLPALVVLPVVLASAAYFFSGWNPIESHIDSSLPRLVLHVAPVSVLLVVLAATHGPVACATSRVRSDQNTPPATKTATDHSGPPST